MLLNDMELDYTEMWAIRRTKQGVNQVILTEEEMHASLIMKVELH